MKKLHTLLFISLLSLCFVQCTKDNPEPDTSSFLEAKIDGVQWKSSWCSFVMIDNEPVIAAESSDGNTYFNFYFDEPAVVGKTYPIYNYKGILAGYGSKINSNDDYSSLAGNSPDAQVGQITIQSFEDGVMTGTFNFIGEQTTTGAKKNFTEGKFKARNK